MREPIKINLDTIEQSIQRGMENLAGELTKLLLNREDCECNGQEEHMQKTLTHALSTIYQQGVIDTVGNINMQIRNKAQEEEKEAMRIIQELAEAERNN